MAGLPIWDYMFGILNCFTSCVRYFAFLLPLCMCAMQEKTLIGRLEHLWHAYAAAATVDCADDATTDAAADDDADKNVENHAFKCCK